MKLASHSILIPATIDAAWDKLVFWKEWPSWDGGMETVSMDGPLRLGSEAKLKLKDGPNVKLVVTEFIDGRSYTSEFKLLGTRFVFGHFLEALNGGDTRVTVTADADGLTAPVLGAITGTKLKKEVPGWMEDFKKQLLNANATTP